MSLCFERSMKLKRLKIGKRFLFHVDMLAVDVSSFSTLGLLQVANRLPISFCLFLMSKTVADLAIVT